MGWLWSSPPKPTIPLEPTIPPEPITPPEPIIPPEPVLPPEPQLRADKPPIDAEMQKFLDLVDSDGARTNPPTSPQSNSTTPSSSSSSSSSSSWRDKFKLSSSSETTTTTSPPSTKPLANPVAEATLQSDMSCVQSLDYALRCNSLTSQVNAVYRYGTMRSCSNHWADFWFCMRIRTHAPEIKEQMIRDYYRQKEREKYGPGKPSSEDIWRSRHHKVESGSVFDHPIADPAAIGDEEWRQIETERRRQIRQNLGYED